MNYDFDLIYGMHSVAEAIKNKKRTGSVLYCTDESFAELRKTHFKANALPQDLGIKTFSSHALQEHARTYMRSLEFKEVRVPSNIFLKSDRYGFVEINDFYDHLEAVDNIKILVLDQVTDVHNLAAILRTAAFYHIDAVVFSKKGQRSFPPTFFRIASGGLEHVKLVNCSSVSKFIHKLKERGVSCFGLSEHASQERATGAAKSCFVMGSEESGLSNATMRVLDDFVCLQAKGQIKSLNVSVAAAVAIEKFWSS